MFCHMLRQNRWLALALLVSPILLAACGADDTGRAGEVAVAANSTTAPPAPSTSGSSGTASSTTTTEAVGSDAVFPDGLRDVRYCEVLLLSKPAAHFEAEVWTTIGLNDCPAAAWESLDPAQIAAEHGALFALLNGPRAWTLDAIVTDIRTEARTAMFGGLDMFRAATVDLGAELPSQTPYTERLVNRETVFEFRAGSEVYELTSPTGQRYVMQSYSQQVDPTLTFEALASLGSRLALPEGWTWSSRVLDYDLGLLSVDGVAVVIQDEFQNTYQRVDRVAR